MKHLILLLAIMLAACAAPGQTQTIEPAPTSTLIPPTATETPIPPTATSTAANLPAPPEIVPSATIMTAAPPATLVDEDVSLAERDPVAAELARLAQAQVARETGLPTRRIQLVDIRPVIWTDSTLNCPLPESTSVPMTIDGYRIVVKAGDQRFIYHTDFDRVIACDPAAEELPDGAQVAVELTAEATAEITPETTAESGDS